MNENSKLGVYFILISPWLMVVMMSSWSDCTCIKYVTNLVHIATDTLTIFDDFVNKKSYFIMALRTLDNYQSF